MNTDPASDAADRASLSALMVCWAREIAALPTRADIWRIPVAEGWIEARFARPLSSGMGPLSGLVHQVPSGAVPVSAGTALTMMLNQLCHDFPQTGPALADRIRHSQSRMQALIAGRISQPDPAINYLSAEQELICGHWMHPSPKSLGGMTADEEYRMTPDWRGAVELVVLSVAEDLIETGGCGADALDQMPWSDHAPDMGHRLFPVHPLAWDRLCKSVRVRDLISRGAIRELGTCGGRWWATSSVRSLWNPDNPWMIKVSLPVTITNSQRMNKRHELLAGEAMTRHLAAIKQDFGPLCFITDPGWATLRLEDGALEAESGFEVIFRQNPYRQPQGGPVVQVAALTAPALPGHSGMLARLLAGGMSDGKAGAVSLPSALEWFDAWLGVTVAPLLRLYDRTGIAFEAHQQNVLIALRENGLPFRAELRDNQGFYVARDAATPQLCAIPQLVYPRAEAEDALAYTLLVNLTFGLIHRMDCDGLLAERQAMERLVACLMDCAATLTGAGGALAARWLRQPFLPAKGNLLTQLGGVDELQLPGERAPTIRLRNPLPELAEILVPSACFSDVA